VKPSARGYVLGDDDRLSKEVVRQLNVERQVESDRTPSDIGAPVIDVGIACKDAIELLSQCFTGINRSILRQRQINEKLRAVRWRKELARHERAR